MSVQSWLYNLKFHMFLAVETQCLKLLKYEICPDYNKMAKIILFL